MSRQPEFVMTGGFERTLSDRCIVSCAVGPEYQEPLHSTRLHCEVHAPEAWRLFYRELPVGCPQHEESMYAFKMYAMQRALDAAFRTILWIDSSFQPIGPLTRLWEEIETTGWYVPQQGDATVGEYSTDEMLKYFHVTRDEAMTIPLCYSGLFGFDRRNTVGEDIWANWKESCRAGLWHGAHLNAPGEKLQPWGLKYRGHVSNDPRVSGHRHDEAALSLILHDNGLLPKKLGFLKSESPDGFIGDHIALVIPGGNHAHQ